MIDNITHFHKVASSLGWRSVKLVLSISASLNATLESLALLGRVSQDSIVPIIDIYIFILDIINKLRVDDKLIVYIKFEGDITNKPQI